MNCSEIQNKLIDYIEGGLSIADFDCVATHLMDCGVCQQEAQAIQQVFFALKRQTLADPGDAYWQHFTRRVQYRLKKESRPSLPQRVWDVWESLWAPFAYPAFGVSIFVFLLFGSLFFVTQQENKKNALDLEKIVFSSNITPEAAELILALGDDPYDVASDATLNVDTNMEIDILL